MYAVCDGGPKFGNSVFSFWPGVCCNSCSLPWLNKLLNHELPGGSFFCLSFLLLVDFLEPFDEVACVSFVPDGCGEGVELYGGMEGAVGNGDAVGGQAGA